MSRRTRKILFISAVISFLILSYLLVVFALGYRYDFVENKFLKTGSLRLSINVNSGVYINDEYEGETSFFNRSFNKTLLLPRSYNVRIQEEGYQDWQKNVTIEEGKLTHHRNILLIPDNLEPEQVASPSEELLFVFNREFIQEDKFISPDRKASVSFSGHELWVTYLDDINEQPFRKEGVTERIDLLPQPIEDIQWYKDSRHFIVFSGGSLWFVEIDKRGGTNRFYLAPTNGLFFYDRNENAIFIYDGALVSRINIE